MEVASSSAGVSTFDFRRFFASTKLAPPLKHPSSIKARFESVGYPAYALPPARPILSRRNQCMPEPVPGSSDSDDGEIPSDVAEIESPNPPVHTRGKVPLSYKMRCEIILARVDGQLSEGVLPPYFQYLMELGFNVEQIKKMTKKYPVLANLRVESKIKPLVELLLELGLSHYQLRSAMRKHPPLCGASIERKLMPGMAYLESLGIDKSCWERIICRSPEVITLSTKKVKAIADYFSELGLPPESLGKLLTKAPKLLGLSVEQKIKPITQFLLDKGFSNEEIVTMVTRFGILYNLSLERNLIPKWEFFLEMGYPRSEVVKFPVYFGCSLEGRIKPRFNLVKEHGIPFNFTRLLSISDQELKIILKRKLATGG